MTTPARAFVEQTLLPAFGARFQPSDIVINIGCGASPYREFFPCTVVTADPKIRAGADEVWRAEQIPHPPASFHGVVFLGVFDRLDDPVRAMAEIHRVLKPGGLLLFGTSGLKFPWTVDRDRWRLTPGGVAHVLRAFHILEEHTIEDGVAHLVIAQK